MTHTIKESSTNQANRKLLSDRCGVNDTLALIGKRWMMTVLYEISLGNNQYSSLKKSVPEISEHVLAARVKTLCKQKLVIRHEIPDRIPLQIKYTVTDSGRELLSLISDLCQWTKILKSV
ncbi:winged helix-turn-helix transcriptional regulator [Sphingobacterium sp. ML3W]|uniref:winged helix-turn-helix transcriptional regulator n=1 Tax=Sphingobacterium sp. ML3W TaxID=1538644 RepID=UPI00384C0BC8